MIQFQSTLSSRRATITGQVLVRGQGISIHALLTESDTGEGLHVLWEGIISIHALLTESDHRSNALLWMTPVFQSTLSSRRATLVPLLRGEGEEFQSTLSSRRATKSPDPVPLDPLYFNPRSPHGERHVLPIAFVRLKHISIHALLTESDFRLSSAAFVDVVFQSTLSSRRATRSRALRFHRISHFNPRSPHGERPRGFRAIYAESRFQSTLSSRRATMVMEKLEEFYKYFNPRSPHGERRDLHTVSDKDKPISIHALLTESDGNGDGEDGEDKIFQSTLSSRRATAKIVHPVDGIGFQSTLSSRRATCRPTGGCAVGNQHFNPRSPHGERPCASVLPKSKGKNFNPRSPHGERQAADELWADLHNFNPRSPHGERPLSNLMYAPGNRFQSTLSSRRATSVNLGLTGWKQISIHALLTESDLAQLATLEITWEFQSTLSSRRATVAAWFKIY